MTISIIVGFVHQEQKQCNITTETSDCVAGEKQ